MYKIYFVEKSLFCNVEVLFWEKFVYNVEVFCVLIQWNMDGNATKARQTCDFFWQVNEIIRFMWLGNLSPYVLLQAKKIHSNGIANGNGVSHAHENGVSNGKVEGKKEK